jgi:hypothetical protein
MATNLRGAVLRTLERVVPLIRHHHERLDGSGYPDGLKGREIPVLVRIISVVDVYDALATQRSYKDALPPEKCLSILREEAERGWWDRDVVEFLAEVLPEHLPPVVVRTAPPGEKAAGNLIEAVEHLERAMIVEALRKAGWVGAKAARALGITERMISYKMQNLGIERPRS